MTRISAIFEAHQQGNVLIPYIMAGDPTLNASLEIMHGLVAGGAAAIEVGIPFSDPTADGVAIQQAGLRALKSGTTLKDVLQLCRTFRANHPTIPLIVMGYANPIMQYGYADFAKDAYDAGIDGVIVVDLPPEEEQELQPFLAKAQIDFVRLIAPTTKGTRLERLLKTASGFVYSINVKGITGTQTASADDIAARISEIKAHTPLPVVAGFGIRTAEDVAALRNVADGVVVGSALVEHLHRYTENYTIIAKDFIKALKG
jgi:tryptophan synthase alpha chain